MSVSNPAQQPQQRPSNGLYNLAAGAAILLGILLALGAKGHFSAVWAQLISPDTSAQRLMLLTLPGALLAGNAALNILLGRPLWQARRRALSAALAGNLLAVAYLLYLLLRGVPGHPIGVFLALEMSMVILLAGIRAGLVWAVGNGTPTDAKNSQGQINNRSPRTAPAGHPPDCQNPVL